MSMRAVYDEATGEVLYNILVSDDDLAANLTPGHAAIEVVGHASSIHHRVVVPGGKPSVITRPKPNP